jgi:hypothetical protein
MSNGFMVDDLQPFLETIAAMIRDPRYVDKFVDSTRIIIPNMLAAETKLFDIISTSKLLDFFEMKKASAESNPVFVATTFLSRLCGDQMDAETAKGVNAQWMKELNPDWPWVIFTKLSQTSGTFQYYST